MTGETKKSLDAATLERAGARLRTALALFDTGVALKRAQLRREDPAATDSVIQARLSAWLRTRPGAEHGDSVGVPRVWDDS